MARNKNVTRTIQQFKKQNILAVSVERFNYHAGVRQDLLGFIDLIALDHNKGVIGVQVCSHSELNKHNQKFWDNYDNVINWLKTPGTYLEMWGWRKLKRRLESGKIGNSYIWEPEIIEYDLKYFEDETDN